MSLVLVSSALLPLDQDFTVRDYFTLTQARREHAVTQDFIARSHEKAQGYNWLTGVGAFYRRYTMDAPVNFYDYGISQFIENRMNSAIPEYPIVWDARSFELGSHFTSPNWGAALYHQSTYHWGQWTLQAGLRLDYEHSRLNYRSVTHTGYTIYVKSTGATLLHENIDIDEHDTLDKDFFDILPNVSLTWHPWAGKNHTVYVAVSRGSKDEVTVGLVSHGLLLKLDNVVQLEAGQHFIHLAVDVVVDAHALCSEVAPQYISTHRAARSEFLHQRLLGEGKCVLALRNGAHNLVELVDAVHHLVVLGDDIGHRILGMSP